MHTASVAEWILRRFTTKGRAASTVGDLVEVEQKNGAVRFWLAVAGVVLSLAWRKALAFVAAFYVSGWTFYHFAMAANSVHTQHMPPNVWRADFNLFILIASTLCASALFAAIRYGIQNRTTQLSVAWAILVTLAIFFWWEPSVMVMCIAAALFTASACAMKRKLRMESVVVLVSVMAGLGFRILGFMLAGFLQSALSRRQPWTDHELQQHPFFVTATFSLVVISFWATTAVWSGMHDWRMRSQSLESQREML